jgi:hypothetical protein
VQKSWQSEANAAVLSEYLREAMNSDMEAGSIISLNMSAFLNIAPKTTFFSKKL